MTAQAQLAMEISDDTGLPLSDVLEMDLEDLMWSTDDELEHCPDADDFSYLDDAVGFTPDLIDEIREEDITGHTAEEYRGDAFYGVSYEDQADDDDDQELG